MSPHADYKYILSQSLFWGTIHPRIGSSLSLLYCQDIATWTIGYCPWGHLYKWVNCASSALATPGCFLFVRNWGGPYWPHG